jgi:hypothetical protein
MELRGVEHNKAIKFRQINFVWQGRVFVILENNARHQSPWRERANVYAWRVAHQQDQEQSRVKKAFRTHLIKIALRLLVWTFADIKNRDRIM